MSKGSKDLEAQGAEELAKLDELSPQEALKKAKTLEEKKKFFVQVLSRGVVNDRLDVKSKLPKGRKPLWIRDRDEDIQRILALGGRIEKSEDVGEAGLHGTGDNRIRVGDVILMSIAEEDYSLLQDIKSDWTQNRLTAARREAVGKMRESGLQVIDNSSTNITKE